MIRNKSTPPVCLISSLMCFLSPCGNKRVANTLSVPKGNVGREHGVDPAVNRTPGASLKNEARGNGTTRRRQRAATCSNVQQRVATDGEWEGNQNFTHARDQSSGFKLSEPEMRLRGNSGHMHNSSSACVISETRHSKSQGYENADALF